MSRIAIMQGRLLPLDIDGLQVIPRQTWRDAYGRGREIGFDAIEVLVDCDGICLELLSENGDTFLRGDLPVSSVCLDLMCGFSLVSQPVAFCDALMRILDAFNGIFSGVMVLPFFGEGLLTERHDAERIFPILRERGVIAAAKESGIAFALEADLSAEDWLEVLETEDDRETIGICYDLGNARSCNRHPEDEILKLADHIIHVHIKDRPVGGKNVALGEGDVDLRACFRALSQVGYQGVMTLETPYFESPSDEAAANLAYVRRLEAESQR